MTTDELIVQDLMDILHISHERVTAYNMIAYTCENLQLKILLNQEMDQTREAILGIKKLLHERFAILSEHETKGPLYALWSDFKPALDTTDVFSQLLNFELAGLLTLQCYCQVITKSPVESIARHLLEFQYQSTLLSYYGMKAFRSSYQKKKSSAALYPLLKSA